MKTRERILQTSLLLFNEEGESHVTTLEIANEMEISPGNLYYHFRGKEAIIPELFDRFEHELTSILNAPIENPLSIEDNWFFLYVVFEEIHEYRFIYRNLSDLLQRFEVLHRHFSRLLDLKTLTAKAICTSLMKNQIININEEEITQLANSITMTITFWMNFQQLRTSETPSHLLMHQGVFQVMSLLAPYFTEQHREFYDGCHAFYQEVLKEVS
jgi:AcrR family transcriptional regulator